MDLNCWNNVHLIVDEKDPFPRPITRLQWSMDMPKMPVLLTSRQHCMGRHSRTGLYDRFVQQVSCICSNVFWGDVSYGSFPGISERDFVWGIDQHTRIIHTGKHNVTKWKHKSVSYIYIYIHIFMAVVLMYVFLLELVIQCFPCTCKPGQWHIQPACFWMVAQHNDMFWEGKMRWIGGRFTVIT